MREATQSAAAKEQDENTGNAAIRGTQQALTRETLYRLVWSEPMLKVAAQVGVSSSYMARVCALLNVPRPGRGYWAKLAAGKKTLKPALPDPRPGDGLLWSRDASQSIAYRPLTVPPADTPKRRARPVEPRPTYHPLIAGAKPLFEAGRFSYSVGYLKPSKRLLVDLAVTKSGLDKALSFANQIFLALEKRGHRVVIAPSSEHFRRAEFDEHEVPQRDRGGHNNLWSPGRCTVVYIGTVAIGLTIVEMSEEVEARHVDGKYVRLSEYTAPNRRRYTPDAGWTTKHDFSTSRLFLQAFSPYSRTKWVQQWRETQGRDLVRRIPAVVKELEQSVAEIARLVEEGERIAEQERQRWDAQQMKWRKDEAERRVAKAREDSKAGLVGIIDSWARIKRVEAFLSDAERRLSDLSDDEREKMLQRLALARELIGSSDALEQLRSWKAPEER